MSEPLERLRGAMAMAMMNDAFFKTDYDDEFIPPPPSPTFNVHMFDPPELPVAPVAPVPVVPAPHMPAPAAVPELETEEVEVIHVNDPEATFAVSTPPPPEPRNPRLTPIAQ
jgi:hypothetical protein